MPLGLGITMGIGGGKPGRRSIAAFTSGPTLEEIIDDWNLEFGAEKITFNALPTVNLPVVTFGAEKVTVTG